MAINQEKKYNEEDNRWRELKYQNIAAINIDTQHTMDSVFGHIKNHLTNNIERLTGIKILKVETPDKDISKQRGEKSARAMLTSTELPRAIMLSVNDTNKDNMVVMPNSEQHYRGQNALQAEVFTLRKRGEDFPYFSHIYDLNMSLGANVTYNTIGVIYSVLVDSKSLANEMAKLLKRSFPLDLPREIYARRDFDEKDKIYMNIPYEIQSVIPKQTIELIKKTLQIKPDEDDKLNEVFKKFCDNIEYKVDGAKREFRYFNNYYSQIIMNVRGIMDAEATIDGEIASYYTVRLEMDVTYIEYTQYKISTSNRYLNPKYAHEKPYDVGIPINIARFSEDVHNCTRYQLYTVEYDKMDLKRKTVENSVEIKEYLEIDFDVAFDDYMISEYIDYVYSIREMSEIHEYFNIEAIRQKRYLRSKDNIVGTSIGVTVDYARTKIVDEISKVGDCIFIALYINKQDFTLFKEKKGYTTKKNMSVQ